MKTTLKKEKYFHTFAPPEEDINLAILHLNPQNSLKMIPLFGTIIGDICGSIYEFKNFKTDKPDSVELINEQCHFTDDTVLTAAVALVARLRAIGYTRKSYGKALHESGREYPEIGYGPMFSKWLRKPSPYNILRRGTVPKPYNSFSNGSAMRVSAIGWYFEDEATVLEEARLSAEPTHNHPEGIKGAQAVALAIYLARNGASKEQIKERIQKDFGYDMRRTLTEIRPTHKFDITCQGTVPVAIVAFLESNDFVSAIQNAISLGGDADTIAAITGSIAEAYYRDIPDYLKQFAIERLHTVHRDDFDNKRYKRDYYMQQMLCVWSHDVNTNVWCESYTRVPWREVNTDDPHAWVNYAMNRQQFYAHVRYTYR